MKKEWLSPWTWMAAVLLFIAIFLLVVPVIIVVMISLGGHDFVAFPPRTISLRWFMAIPEHYYEAFLNSMLVAMVSTIISILLGVPAALALVRTRNRSMRTLDAFFRMPLHIPTIVLGVAFMQFYIFLFQTMGIQLRGSFSGLVLGHTILIIPYVVSACIAALHQFNNHWEEAAYGLGASVAETLRFVTLPVLRPAIFSGAFFSFIISFDNVPVSLFLVSSGFRTLPIEIFTAADQALTPVVFAVSTLVIIFSTLITVVFERLIGFRRPQSLQMGM